MRIGSAWPMSLMPANQAAELGRRWIWIEERIMPLMATKHQRWGGVFERSVVDLFTSARNGPSVRRLYKRIDVFCRFDGATVTEVYENLSNILLA